MPASRTVEFENNRLVPLLFGEHNAHLNLLEQMLGISISDRGNTLFLEGADKAVAQAENILNALWDKLQHKQEIGPKEVEAAIRFVTQDLNGETVHGKKKNGMESFSDDRLVLKTKKKSVAPRTPVQADYVRAILDSEMVFGLGPAGTGKTYLAVAAAVQMFLAGKIERMIFCRPAVEAGEQLGFLPGDMREKVDPYLRPIYDALQDMLPWDFVQKKMADGDIEIAPLAFMRGRTLSNAFVILDEAQNATPAQMKMFLTRMGDNSRIVVTGDATQSDLPYESPSGLADALHVLKNVEEIKFIHFSEKDVVRHHLVSKIVKAYESGSN